MKRPSSPEDAPHSGADAQTTSPDTASPNLQPASGSVCTGAVSNAPGTECKSLAASLEAPDSHYLNAAEGWLGLGDCQSALHELANINTVMQSHPDVLSVRCDIYTAAMNWPAVVAVSWTLVQLAPERPLGWVRRSFGLHGLKRTQQALDLLLPAFEKFPSISTIPYNLACYSAQLGRLEDARQWLEKSYAIGNARELKFEASRDPDLAALFAGPSGL